jgi:hypothetical protein
MFAAYTVALVAALHLRQPVNLPFPDADKAAQELDEQNALENPQPQPALVEQKSEATQDTGDAVAAWTPPTLAPDPAIMSTDQFKHPTAQQLKDWESAPKIDMFEEPTMKPLALATETKTAPTPEAPKVESKLHPVNPYGKKDDDPELAAIQQESPDAYGIVKALMMKKEMGLPMPGQDAAKKESDAARSFGSQEAGPSSSAHIGDMFSWKPPGSAADDLSAIEDDASVSKTMVPDEPAPEPKAEEPQPEPQAVEEPKAAPAQTKDMFNWKPASVDADAMAAPAAPAAEAPAAAPAAKEEESSDSDSGIALNSWLGASTTKKVAAPQEKVAATSGSWGNDMMSRYSADLA